MVDLTSSGSGQTIHIRCSNVRRPLKTRHSLPFQKQVRDGILALLGDVNQKTTGDVGFREFGKLIADRRTSLITDPADGRLPALLPEARRRLEASGHQTFNGPEDFDAAAPSRDTARWPQPARRG
jgi:hypothetical protein